MTWSQKRSTAAVRADHTTVNELGRELVIGGVIHHTTINGGFVFLDHATADNTKINFSTLLPNSFFAITDHSVANNTTIAGGGIGPTLIRGMIIDATSKAVNVDFVTPGGLGEGVSMANPTSLQGTIKGLTVNDFLQFGGLAINNSIDVTSFTLTNKQHDLKIFNGTTLLATYHLEGMQAGTTFALSHSNNGPFGSEVSTLTVVKAAGVADVAQHDGLLL